VGSVKPLPLAFVTGDTDEFGFRGETRAYTAKLLHLFEVHLKGGHGLGDGSLELAMGKVKGVLRFVRKPIWRWCHADVTNFIAHKRDTVENLAVSTQAGYFAYLRSLQSWLFSDLGLRQEILTKFGVQVQEWIDERNAIPIRNKNRKGKKRDALSADDFARLMGELDAEIKLAFACGSKAAYPLARDKAILAAMYGFGVRVSNAVAVRMEHFKPDRRHPIFERYARLRVYAKGGITGTPHLLDPQLSEVFEWYEKYIRPHFLTTKTKDIGLFFYSERGDQLGSEQIRRRLKAIASRAGIKANVTPHVLRHTHCTDAMELLGPVGTQRQMLHADIRTTFAYRSDDPAEVGRDVANAVQIVIDAAKSTPTKDPI